MQGLFSQIFKIDFSLYIRVLQKKNSTNFSSIYQLRDVYYKTLAHMIIEAEKSYGMQSASWRPRRVGGIIPVQVWRPEKQEKWLDKF